MAHAPADSRVTALAAAGLVVLTLAGAGLYALAPLTGSQEDDALAAVESAVKAWAEQRCEDAASLIDGPRNDVLAACSGEARTESLEIATSEVELDGDRGTATLELRWLEDGKPQSRDVVEQLVRVDGEWKVAWRRR